MNKKIVEYTVVYGKGTQDLYNEVNNKIKQNYQPFGNLVCDSGYFIQTMVKYDS